MLRREGGGGGGLSWPSGCYSFTSSVLNFKLYIYMLPPEWIFQPEPLRLTQIWSAEWIQGWTQTFRPTIWKANMFVFPFNFFTVIWKIHISVMLLFHGERVLRCCIALTWSYQGWKEHFTTNICPEYKYEQYFFYSDLKKGIFAF